MFGHQAKGISASLSHLDPAHGSATPTTNIHVLAENVSQQPTPPGSLWQRAFIIEPVELVAWCRRGLVTSCVVVIV